MPEAVHGDARGEVQVLAPLGVPDDAALAVREHGRGAATVRPEDALALVLPHGLGVDASRGVGDGLRAPDARGGSASIRSRRRARRGAAAKRVGARRGEAHGRGVERGCHGVRRSGRGRRDGQDRRPARTRVAVGAVGTAQGFGGNGGDDVVVKKICASRVAGVARKDTEVCPPQRLHSSGRSVAHASMLARAPVAAFTPRARLARRRASTLARASARSKGDGSEERASSEEAVKFHESLKRRRRTLKQLRLQRSRVSVGDYVSDEVTRFRGERFRVEQTLFGLRRDLEAKLTLERFTEAKAVQAQIDQAQTERERFTRAIEEATENALRRYDEQL